MSDEALPISFENTAYTSTPDDSAPISDATAKIEEKTQNQGELALSTSSVLKQGQDFFEPPSEELLRTNPYMKVVSTLSPSELISKFTKTSSPRVQNAVRSTILGLIGSLPKMAFDTTTITTGQRLASLMFQLQMTGYLFKNAEYRLSLSQSLGTLSDTPAVGPGSQLTLPGVDEHDDEDDDVVDPLKGKIRGSSRFATA
ncbi:DUF760-containing protein [Fragilaria crotonensis]|nr:DUF760-containing protein [Fragilaria crotonensis]